MSDFLIPEVLENRCAGCGIVHAPVNYHNAVARRREIEENLAGYGWGPSKIGRHLFKFHRDLMPSDSEEQAIDLARKDLKVIFSDVDDAEDAMRKGRMAEKLLRKRLMELYQEAHTNARSPTASEPFRAASAKLELEIIMKLGKLDRVDVDDTKKNRDTGRFVVQVGGDGVARTKEQSEPEDQGELN